MKSSLLNNLEDGVKDQITSEFLSSFRLRERLCEMLERDIEAIYVTMRKEEYKDASWPYKQASLVGETKALKKLISLLSD